MKKRITKRNWYDDELEDGKAKAPSVAPDDERHLEGINRGEISINDNEEDPTIFIRDNKGNVVGFKPNVNIDIEELKKLFISKTRPDETEYPVDFLAGATFGHFIPGILGAIIDQFGDGEMGSLVLRKFLSVPELRFNRAIVYKGKQIISPGGGCLIESFTLNGDGTWTIAPKLEEGEPLSQDIDDILLAYWHDKDVDTGAFKGFREMKFRVVSADFDAKTFVISPKPDSLSVPAIAMTLAQVGNFTNKERQTYIMIDSTLGNNNITFFDDCNTWEIEEHQEKSWFGKKKGRKVAGIDASVYSAVLQNIIMSGLIFQIDEISGDMVRVPCDKGAHIPGKKYAYYDRVSSAGALWLCINEKGTSNTPTDGSKDWLKQVSEGKQGTPGESIRMLGHWNSSMRPVPANCMVSYAKGIYLSLRETNQAPVSTLMCNDGSYMTNGTGGYILASDEVNEDWELVIENGNDGVSMLFQGSFPTAPNNPKDGWSYYNTTDKRSYVYQGDKWYVTAIDGKDGKDFEWIYTRTKTNEKPVALESIQEDDYVPPGWTDNPQGCTAELPFEWTCKRIKKDSVWQPFSAASIFNMYAVGETGPAGIIPCGHWQSANTPYRKTSLVTLNDATFVALVDTSKPPVWLMKWGSGPRDYLTNNTGGYFPLGDVEKNLNPEWLMLTPPPVNGNDSTSYWLTCPVSAININSVGSLSPSSVLISCKKKKGECTVSDCSDFFLAARKYNGSWLAHVSPVKASSISLNAVGGYTQFTVRAYNSESEANSWSSGFVAEIGVGVSKDGAIGDTGPAGSFPRDRGVFVDGTSYVWSPSYRDKVLYPFDGVYYNFLVGNFGATVTAAPTSASGDGLWESMGKHKSIATDTLFADGANVANFMFKNGILRSQDETDGVPNIMLNGKTGEINAQKGTFAGEIKIAGGKILLNKDGSGKLADGSFYWDSNGIPYIRHRFRVLWRDIRQEMEDANIMNTSGSFYTVELGKGTYLDVHTGYDDIRKIKMPLSSNLLGEIFDVRCFFVGRVASTYTFISNSVFFMYNEVTQEYENINAVRLIQTNELSTGTLESVYLNGSYGWLVNGNFEKS